MRTTTKIVGVVAAAALVAGAGLASAPANAAAAKPLGKTGLSVPPALMSGAAAAGVTLSVLEPATAVVDGSTGYTTMNFPVTEAMEGELKHSGTLSIASASTGLTLTLANPVLGYATDTSGTGTIAATLGGAPAPFDGLNGQSITAFNLSDVKITTKKGKVRGKGKSWKRTDTATLTANAAVTSNTVVVDALNNFLGVPLFTAGAPFGAVKSTWRISHNCTSKAACQK